MESQNNVLPSPDENIQMAYKQLITDLEATMDKLIGERFHSILQCGPGCSDCCIQFSILPLEAAIVSKAVNEKGISGKADSDKCLLLDNDLCMAYEVRPVICRTQGLALGYVDEAAGTIEVSACLLNFPDDYPLSQDNLLYMDQFNSKLAELNLQYCRDNGLAPEVRIPIADLVG